MTSIPYPIFVTQLPVDKQSTKRCALTAVGRCRIHPETCVATGKEEYRAICSKTWEQAKAGTATLAAKAAVKEDAAAPGKKKDNNTTTDPLVDALEQMKKLKKKYMKQAVAMASRFLQSTCGIDVSIINVEVVLNAKDIIETEGCLAGCWLDAGCSAIVIEGTTTNNVVAAMELAGVPRDRIIAHFDGAMVEQDGTRVLQKWIPKVLPWASTISLEISSDKYSFEKTVPKVISLVSDPHDHVIFQLQTLPSHSTDDIAAMVAQISVHAKDGKGWIALVDPTAKTLGYSFAACMKTDRKDGLFTTVVCTRSGEALGLVYSSKESMVAALECGRGVYYSRSRQGLWRKGDTSGHYQTLHRLDVDCDGDALRFTVTQRGDASTAAFCHLDTFTCWGEARGIRHLEGTLQERLKNAPEGSYTKRLFEDPILLRNKLVEEAQELSEATDPKDVASELADVLYFAMARAVQAGVSMDDAVAELDRRTRKVTRRQGDSKAHRIAAGEAILGTKS